MPRIAVQEFGFDELIDVPIQGGDPLGFEQADLFGDQLRDAHELDVLDVVLLAADAAGDLDPFAGVLQEPLEFLGDGQGMLQGEGQHGQ